MEKHLFKRKSFVMGVIILIVFVISALFLTNKNDICNKINDESIRKNCKSCKNSEDPLDCKDNIYISLAVLNQNASFCDKVAQEYRKEECLLQAQRSAKIGSRIANRTSLEYDPDSGEYKIVQKKTQ